jgi:hypothetical protein
MNATGGQLAQLDRPFVPHVRSPGRIETAAPDMGLIHPHGAAGQPHGALRDGEVLRSMGRRSEVLRTYRRPASVRSRSAYDPPKMR